jgi:hypothetical protein
MTCNPYDVSIIYCPPGYGRAQGEYKICKIIEMPLHPRLQVALPVTALKKAGRPAPREKRLTRNKRLRADINPHECPEKDASARWMITKRETM